MPESTRGSSEVREYRHELLATYRYLRLAIILLTLLLGTAIGLQIIADGGAVLPSVSAYYYSPASGVFVASLCAVGACMVIHRGRSDLEDVLLNFSGYLAFFVAFVPTPREQVDGQGTAVVPADFTDAVINNTWAILIVGAVAFVVEMAVLPQRERSTHSRGGKAALVFSALAYLGLLLFFLLAREQFLDWGHGLAAIVLFLGIVGVVGVNGIAMARARQEAGYSSKARWLNRYTYGFLGMIVSAVLIVVAVRPFVEQWIFVLEAALIAQFLGFWITQTVERWTAPERRQDALVPG
ncbi:hypothetical protein [Pseudactinotalea sp.]|uniref:hypothetical protein n=1 Tax=Pseudactinotalea sp. TaxID=1926260 RepID=UPI003B3B545C